ncbi:MAG: MraY family glycosyltransferase [Pseudomonadota bacterium]
MSAAILALFCIVAGCGAFVICKNAIALGNALKVVDYPDVAGGRKRHATPTPLVGGIAVLVGTGLTAPLFLLVSDLSLSQNRQISVIAFLAAVFALLGFIDDRHTLSPKIRLLVLVLATAAVVTNEPALTVSFLHFSFLPKAYILGNWGIIFTMISIVGLSNAVNMADGKNGLVIGMSIVWTVTLLLLGAPVMQPVLFALLTTLILALIYNMRSKLFLGDAGSFGIAAVIGLTTIYSYTQNFVSLTADIIVLMFFVPVLDCLRLMVTRILRGRSPFTAGRDHLHHYLGMRWHWPTGLMIYLGLVGGPLMLGAIAPTLAFTALLVQLFGYCALMAYTTSTRHQGSADAQA